MKHISIVVVILMMAVVQGMAQGPKAELRNDIELTIRHTDGSTEKYGSELAELEIVVGPDSVIKYLHLVIVGGKEKDTHAWYNIENVVSFKYRFLAITGKGKVKLKQLDKFATKPKDGIAEQIPLQDVDDFK